MKTIKIETKAAQDILVIHLWIRNVGLYFCVVELKIVTTKPTYR